MESDSFATPAGNGDYVVSEGECLESIAFNRRLLWQTIWNHPNNKSLKEARDRNILLPGDRLFIPPVDPKSLDAATEVRHKYVRKGLQSRFRIQILEWVRSDSEDSDDDSVFSRPRPQVPYVLVIDGQSTSGTTDAEGWIDEPISPGAVGGSLTLDPGTPQAYSRSVVLGGLDPLDAASGICQRLANLGFLANPSCPSDSPEFQDALKAFQSANHLNPTGTADGDTLSRLQQIHNS